MKSFISTIALVAVVSAVTLDHEEIDQLNRQQLSFSRTRTRPTRPQRNLMAASVNPMDAMQAQSSMESRMQAQMQAEMEAQM